jgi:hypothetical protein
METGTKPKPDRKPEIGAFLRTHEEIPEKPIARPVKSRIAISAWARIYLRILREEVWRNGTREQMNGAVEDWLSRNATKVRGTRENGENRRNYQQKKEADRNVREARDKWWVRMWRENLRIKEFKRQEEEAENARLKEIRRKEEEIRVSRLPVNLSDEALAEELQKLRPGDRREALEKEQEKRRMEALAKQEARDPRELTDEEIREGLRTSRSASRRDDLKREESERRIRKMNEIIDAKDKARLEAREKAREARREKARQRILAAAPGCQPEKAFQWVGEIRLEALELDHLIPELLEKAVAFNPDLAKRLKDFGLEKYWRTPK